MMRALTLLPAAAMVAVVHAADSGTAFSPTLREAYLAEAASSLHAQAGMSAEFEVWLAKHPEVRTGLLVSGDPVAPHYARQLDALRIALGPERADRYASLLLACALRAQDAAVTPAIAPDERVKTVAAYLKEKGMSLLDAKQAGDEFFTAAKVAAPSKKEVGAFWEELAHVTGTYPRRENMALADSLKLLIERQETKLGPFASGPGWPLYPIAEAPWPLLAPLRQTLPRSEADYLWDHFRGETPYADGSRWKTYARYSWDYDRDLAVRWKQSAFHPNSIPRIAEDGGVCGRLSTLGQFSCAALGKPAVGMYQPGHRAMLSYNRDAAGLWFAKLEQSITGPENSTNQWFLPLPAGKRVSGDEASGVKIGVEWHVALNLAMNVGLERWTDARIALFSARRLHAKDPVMAAKLAEEAATLNPYLLDAWYQSAAWAGGDLKAVNALLKRFDTLLLDPSKAADEDEELSADTDFNKITPLKGGADPKKDSALVAKVMGPILLKAAYEPALGDKDKAKRGEAFALLREEVARREALKMPYEGGVRELVLKFEVAVDGPRAAQQRMEKSLLEWAKGDAKRRGKAAPGMLGEIAAVASGLPDAKARVAWFERMQRGIPAEIAIAKGKDGKAAADVLYKGLHDLQVKEFKAQGKAGAKDVKRLQEEWDRVVG